jgi:carbon storage regulator
MYRYDQLVRSGGFSGIAILPTYTRFSSVRLWPANCITLRTDFHHALKEEKLMLVLTRKLGQAIILDGGIRVTITAIKGDKVRIGVEAPPEVRVDREEVHRRFAEFAAPEFTVAGR